MRDRDPTPFSRGLTFFAIQKLMAERRAVLLISVKLTGGSLEKALNLLDPTKSKT
jgi:hypothetical protein